MHDAHVKDPLAVENRKRVGLDGRCPGKIQKFKNPTCIPGEHVFGIPQRVSYPRLIAVVHYSGSVGNLTTRGGESSLWARNTPTKLSAPISENTVLREHSSLQVIINTDGRTIINPKKEKKESFF